MNLEQSRANRGVSENLSSSPFRPELALPKCRGCGCVELEVCWTLNPSPYGDLFRQSRNDAKELPKVGLTLAICSGCLLLQLLEEVDSVQIYSDYLYQTGITVGLPDFYTRLAGDLCRRLELTDGELVVDVGSNDGSGLVPFKNLGMEVVGIEPAHGPAAAATNIGIPTKIGFLSQSVCDEVVADFGQARLICANAVLANVPDPLEFLRCLGGMLADNGVISIVTGYHPDEFAVNMFDYINHDHLSYFTVASMSALARLAGLELVSASRVEHKGGSIHFVLSSGGDRALKVDESIEKLLQREEWLSANQSKMVEELARRIARVKQKNERLLNLTGANLFAGIGASISTTHLLHQFELGNRISALYDEDIRKVGRYSPGFGIEVRSLSEVDDLTGGVLLLLAWQHTSVLLRRLQVFGFRGRVIVPLPEPQVVQINGLTK